MLEWKDLNHWKARLHAQRLDRTTPATPGRFKKERMPAGNLPECRKRKGTPVFRYPPGYRNEPFDDEESDDLFLPKDNIPGPKIKQESINSISSAEIDALYDDPDLPYTTSSQSSKRSKVDLSGRFSVKPPPTPLRAGTASLATPMPSPIRDGSLFSSTKKRIDVNE